MSTPTVAETLPGFVTGSWQGLLAPSGTPADNIPRLHAALARVPSLPDVRERLAVQGADTLGHTPAESSRFLAGERDRWAPAHPGDGLQTDVGQRASGAIG